MNAKTLTALVAVAALAAAGCGTTPTGNSATISGRVVLAGMPPTAGITVVLIGPVSPKIRTDDTGAYRFEDVPAGTYQAVASAGDHTKEKAAALRFTVAAGEQVTLDDLELTPTGDIAGRVVVAGQTSGLVGIQVFIAGTSYAATTKDDGSYQIAGVPVGTYDVHAQGRRTTLGEVKGVKVDFATVATAGDIAVEISSDSAMSGEDGLNCWDLDGDGIQDPAEDVSGDGFWNTLDCQGAGAAVTPPDTQISAGPAVATTEATATFTFAGADDVAVSYYQCRLDHTTFQTCSSPHAINGLTDGFYVFEARAVDNGGNVDPTPAEWAWSVATGPVEPKWTLPDTGQNQCYDASAPIACPTAGNPFFGQDAQHGSNSLDLVDNGDGTVTDNITGLMWQQQDYGVWRQWSEAMGYCAGLLLAGYTDWRLPDRFELQSIVDYGRDDPAIDTALFPGTTSDNYWSSSPDADDSTSAWFVGFFSGSVFSDDKTVSYYARCVRP